MMLETVTELELEAPLSPCRTKQLIVHEVGVGREQEDAVLTRNAEKRENQEPWHSTLSLFLQCQHPIGAAV